MNVIKHAATALFAASFLMVCAQTPAQAGLFGKSLRTVANEYAACMIAVANDPSVSLIKARVPLKPTEASLQQLMSTDKISDAETAQMYIRHDKAQPCRDAYLAELNRIDVGRASVGVEEFAQFDKQVILLIQKKQTWGEYVTAVRDIVVAGMNRQTQLIQQQQQNAAMSSHDSGDSYIPPQSAAPAAPVVTPPRTCRTILVGNVARTQCY